MKYLKQFLIIAAVSFAGESLKWLIPLPVSANVYGIVLMFLCLEFHIIRLDDIRETGLFLIEIMPVMFIPAAVGLMDSWELIRVSWFPYIITTVLSTIAVFSVSGLVTQTVSHRAAGEKYNE